MHLQVGTEKRLLSDVLDSPERSAHCVKALEFLLQAPSDPADAVPPPSLREALSLAGTGSQAPGGNAAHQGKALEGAVLSHREGGTVHRLARPSM